MVSRSSSNVAVFKLLLLLLLFYSLLSLLVLDTGVLAVAGVIVAAVVPVNY